MATITPNTSTAVTAPHRRRLPALLRSPTALLGVVVVVIVIVAALFAPWLAPHAPNQQSILDRLLPPMSTAMNGSLHVLGTDGLGRDILSRIIYGARISLLVGVVSVLLGGTLGVIFGLFAGYRGGWFDSLIMRLVDIQLAIPLLILVIALVAVLGSGVGNVIIALAIGGWLVYARAVRAEVLVLREKEFVEGAKALGIGEWRVLTRHILPNTMSTLTVLATLEVGRVILSEASLSYLGLGVPPTVPSWGGMVAEGQAYVYNAWWVSLFPGLAILLTVLAMNFLGDWLRDVFDPRLRNSDA